MISRNIRKLADEKRISLKEIADYTKISQQGLNKMLNNDDFKSSTLIQIAELLNVSISLLFDSEPKITSVLNKAITKKVIFQIEVDESVDDNYLKMVIGKDFLKQIKK